MKHMIAALSLLALTACTTTQTVRTPLADRIPAALLTCRVKPVAGAMERQSDVAEFVVELNGAGEDCRRKLKAINGIVQSDQMENPQ